MKEDLIRVMRKWPLFHLNLERWDNGDGDDKTPFIQHGAKPIVTGDDAKLAATRFAGYVS